MNEHYDAVEAALRSEYGLDLGESLYGRMRIGARRLWALIMGLPPMSALHRAVNPEGWNWTYGDELLATLVEQIDHSNRMFYVANSAKSKDVWDPVKVPRPKQTMLVEETRQQSSTEQLRDFVRWGEE